MSRAVLAARATIARLNPHCRAVLDVAKCAEQSALPDGPLSGLPILVKDNIVTRDMITTCGSRVLEGYRSPFDATAVRLLREAGATLLGKTNMDEFAMGSRCDTSAYGECVQLDAERTPAGGSSGGSAVAVQSGMCFAALASDTGGSIALPAVTCSVFGFRPTYGAVSRYGLVPYACSFDTIGVMARDIDGTSRILDVIAQPDSERDMTSISIPRDSRLPRRRFRVGVPSCWDPCGRLAERVAAQVPEAEVVRLEDVAELEDEKATTSAYYALATAEAASNLAHYDGRRYGRALERAANATVRARVAMGQRLLLHGRHVLRESEGYRAALKARFAGIFASYKIDVVVCEALLRRDSIRESRTMVGGLTGIPVLAAPHSLMEVVDTRSNGTLIFGPAGSDFNTLAISKRLLTSFVGCVETKQEKV